MPKSTLPRILILSPSAPPVAMGGIASAHHALYEGLRTRGFDVALHTFADFGRSRFFRDADPSVHRFGSARLTARMWTAFFRVVFMVRECGTRLRIYQTADVWKTRAGMRRMRAAVERLNPDVVIFPDQASPAYWLKRRPGQRWIQISHHHALRFVNQPELGLHSLKDAHAARRLEMAQAAECDTWVAPSHYMADVIRSFLPQSPSTQRTLRVIANPVPQFVTESVAPRPAVEPRRVFIPSGGSRFKGSEVVPELIAQIQAGARAGDAWEYFISGPLTEAQRSAITRRAPTARVVCRGQLPASEVILELRRATVCVSPTWIENQSMALLEAKACGVPFVTFDVGGNRELLGPHDRVVARGDVAALAQASLERLNEPQVTSNGFDALEHNQTVLNAWVELLRAASP